MLKHMNYGRFNFFLFIIFDAHNQCLLNKRKAKSESDENDQNERFL